MEFYGKRLGAPRRSAERGASRAGGARAPRPARRGDHAERRPAPLEGRLERRRRGARLIARSVCLRCGARRPSRRCSRCSRTPRRLHARRCGAILKPNVVMFGELLPAPEIDRAFELARSPRAAARRRLDARGPPRRRPAARDARRRRRAGDRQPWPDGVRRSAELRIDGAAGEILGGVLERFARPRRGGAASRRARAALQADLPLDLERNPLRCRIASLVLVCLCWWCGHLSGMDVLGYFDAQMPIRSVRSPTRGQALTRSSIGVRDQQFDVAVAAPAAVVVAVAAVVALRVVVRELARDGGEPLDLAGAQQRAAPRRPGPGTAGAAWSKIVPKSESVPSALSTRSSSRDCCGQSTWAEVTISQNPPPPGRPCGAIRLRCWCPATSATTPRCRRSRHSIGSGTAAQEPLPRCTPERCAATPAGGARGRRRAHGETRPRGARVQPEVLRLVDVPLVAAVGDGVEHDEADARPGRERVVPDPRAASAAR